ncbi:MAG: hypothetical protein Q7T48_00450 [Cellvibrio sp.]|uniref:hypothetical protein n=1 Tax=Cellvibrio sp. TaxID=1965322 RepID=UPI00271D4BB4|nr:hypothetical protein [Cellvibrio sp.]
MIHTKIVEVGIDEEERLYIIPASVTFPYIYREAMEVRWCPEKKYLYSPKLREWSYFHWYTQVISAVKKQSHQLQVCKETMWVNIPEELKEEILRLEIT